MVVLHTGQTGVERGADRAARALGLTIGGFCSALARDEWGPLPSEIAAELAPCTRTGTRTALMATVALADALVIGVPDVRRARTYPGIDAVRRAIHGRGLPHFLVDPTTDLELVARELRSREQPGEAMRIMVTGPRETRWPDGDRVGWRIVTEMAHATLRARRVLVVDDQEGVLDSMRAYVRALGHECIAVPNGRMALERAAELAPDVALVDLNLPDISGYDVARELRARQDKPLYLAAITGWRDAMDPEPALAAGFDRHVVKPAAPELIQAILEDASVALGA